MPSSPEVWPPRVPDSTEQAREGAPGGDCEGNGRHSYGAQCLLRFPGGCCRARVSVSAPPPPAPSSGHQAQRATSRGATGHFTSAPTHSRLQSSRGTPEATASWSWSSPERSEAGTPSSTPPSSHSSRPPLPPPKPHYAHNLAAATAATLESAYLRRCFGLRSFPAAHWGPLNVPGESS